MNVSMWFCWSFIGETTTTTEPTVAVTTKAAHSQVSETPIHISVKENLSMHALIGK